jgi:tetratricopeptide (TPR) repeat protein
VAARQDGFRAPAFHLALLSIALLVLVGAVFGRVAGNKFVDYDDPGYVTENRHVRAGLTFETAAWAFRTGQQSNWHPLTWLSHALDCQLFGPDPAGHHLVSLALHALNAVLLLLALHRMTGALWRSGMVAALFALHPLHVESVAWAAERKDVLSTLFLMLILLAYARHAARPKTATRLLVPLLFALGLMAKPMLVTLPFVLLLLDFWPLARWGGGAAGERASWLPPRRLVVEKLPLFALAAVSSVVTWLAQQRGGAMAPLDLLPLGVRLENAVVAYVTYLAKTIWPAGLGVLYPIAPSLPAWKVVGACAVLAAITAAVVAAARRAPYLVTGWFWYAGTLVPVIGIVQVGLQSGADRYTYVPLVGVFVMLAWGLPDLLRNVRHRQAVLACAAVLVLTGCSALTWRQVAFWRDSATLFGHTLLVTTDNYVVHNNFGGALMREGRVDEAIAHFEEARRIRPDYAATLSNLGVAVQGKGRIGEAIELYREALKARPEHLEAWLNLGNALGKSGDVEGGLAAFREAERLQRGDPSIGALIRAATEVKARSATPPQVAASALPGSVASYERANGLRERGRFDEAAAAYREAIRIDPGFAEAYNNLGSVLGRQGRAEEAVVEIRKALEISPGLAAAHINLGIVLAMRGKTEEAAGHFAEALRLNPRDASTHFNLGILLMRQGRTADAIAHLEESLRIEPGNESAALALRELRRRGAGGNGR